MERVRTRRGKGGEKDEALMSATRAKDLLPLACFPQRGPILHSVTNSNRLFQTQLHHGFDLL